MICPYCHAEMEEGVLQSERYMLWGKTKHNVCYRPKEGEVLLREKIVGIITMKAYICKI